MSPQNPGPSIRFDDRVTVVTGASDGLGRTHTIGLAAQGGAVVVNDTGGSLDGSGRSVSRAEAVLDEIRRAGGIATADASDIATIDGVRALVARATEAFGGIDLPDPSPEDIAVQCGAITSFEGAQSFEDASAEFRAAFRRLEPS